MPATLEQTGGNVVTPRSAFILRFISTVALWSVALLIMFSGYEIFFWILISVFGMIGLWEFYGMLDHKALPNFKITGMLCGAVMLAGIFYYFSKIGPAGSYDFEVAVLLFFLLTMFGRQMFARLRHDEPLQTMAYTLFGLLYVLWQQTEQCISHRLQRLIMPQPGKHLPSEHRQQKKEQDSDFEIIGACRSYFGKIIKNAGEHDRAAEHSGDFEIRQRLVIEHAIKFPKPDHSEHADQNPEEDLITGEHDQQGDTPESDSADES